MDLKNLNQPKTGSLSSLRAGRVLKPSPLAGNEQEGQNSSADQKPSTPENIRKLRSQKVYSSPSDNIMTPVTRKLNKRHALAHAGKMGKMNFADDPVEENQAASEVNHNENMDVDADSQA